MIDTIDTEETRDDVDPAETVDEKTSEEKPNKKKPVNRSTQFQDDQDESGDDDAPRWTRAKQRIRAGFSWSRFATGAVIVALCGVIVFGSFKYQRTQDELARIHQSEADRNMATQVARDYALKSLNYTYQDPDGFLKSVEDGVAPTLKDKYTNVADLLKNIMLQAKVESTGEILATDTTLQPGGVYQVVVSASQTTKNVQNPQPRVSTIVLQVVLNKIGNAWQISDIGPKGGSKPFPGDAASPGQPGAASGAVPQPNPDAGPVAPLRH